MKGKVLYVASPYYHDNPWVMVDRYEATSRFCLLLLAQGYCPISTVMIWHPAKKQFNITSCESKIMQGCLELLSKCDTVVVLTLPGWKESKGVQEEVAFARSLEIPVRYMNEKDAVITLSLEVCDLNGRD